MRFKTPGRVAYEAYCEAMGGNYRDASTLPEWSELETYERRAWTAVARAAVGRHCDEQSYLKH